MIGAWNSIRLKKYISVKKVRYKKMYLLASVDEYKYLAVLFN